MQRVIATAGILVVAALLLVMSGCGKGNESKAPESNQGSNAAPPAAPGGQPPAEPAAPAAPAEPAAPTAPPTTAPAAATTAPAQMSVAEAQSLTQQAMQYISENKLDLADQALTKLEAVKPSLPKSLQTQIDSARKMLQAKTAAGNLPGLSLPGGK
jgi:hypothetical protein